MIISSPQLLELPSPQLLQASPRKSVERNKVSTRPPLAIKFRKKLPIFANSLRNLVTAAELFVVTLMGLWFLIKALIRGRPGTEGQAAHTPYSLWSRCTWNWWQPRPSASGRRQNGRPPYSWQPTHPTACGTGAPGTGGGRAPP
jgi:hypothetical protein